MKVVRTSFKVLNALQRKYCTRKNYDALRVGIRLQKHLRLRRKGTTGNMFVNWTWYA